MPLSQPGALRCPPLAARRLALSVSRSPAPCAVPTLTTRRRVPSLTADVRLQGSSEERCMRRSSQLSWACLKRQSAIDRVCAPPVRAFFIDNFAYWIIVVCREAKALPARYHRRAR
eukprot:525679-Pleurochrysis_carterae.AAC.1